MAAVTRRAAAEPSRSAAAVSPWPCRTISPPAGRTTARPCGSAGRSTRAAAGRADIAVAANVTLAAPVDHLLQFVQPLHAQQPTRGQQLVAVGRAARLAQRRVAVGVLGW